MALDSGIGNYFAKKLLAKLQGATDFTPPATWYAALLTTLPTDDDGTSLVEPTLATYGYNRVSITNNTTNFPAPTTVSHVATQKNGVAIDWGTASGGNWGTIVGVAFYDASSGGNLGYWGPLNAPVIVNDGSGIKVTANNGAFEVTRI